MYNFSLGMLFATAAMAYTYIFVPESLPIRNARLAKQNSIECQNKPKGNYYLLKITLSIQILFYFHFVEIEINNVEGKGLFEVFKSIFNINNFLNAWRTLLKKRDGHKRLYIILLILAFELEIFLR